MTVRASLHTSADTARITGLMREFSRRYLAPASVRGEIEHYGMEESRARSVMRYSLGYGTALYTTSLAMVDPRTGDAFVDLTTDKLARHGIGRAHKNHAADIAAGIAPEPYSAWQATARAILAELRAQGYHGYARTDSGTVAI